jgi:inorganic pyrophosphatase
VHNDPRYLEVTEFEHVREHVTQEIRQFFETYKNLEGGKWVRVSGWRDRAGAIAEVERTNAIYLETVNKPLVNVPRLDRLDIGQNFPETVNGIIEVSKGDTNIYKIDLDLALIRLDRRLHSSMYYPHNIGAIPQTISEDGSMLAVVIVSMFGLDKKTIVNCRVIGKLEIVNENGPDTRIVAVPVDEPRLT